MEQFLLSVGIKEPKEIIYNPSYKQLFEDEMRPDLDGHARGYLTELGAVNVLTGEYTGRSPKDKFIVRDDTTKDSLWWNGNGAKNDNKSITPEVWGELKDLVAKQLSGKKLYIVDGFLRCQQGHLPKSALRNGSGVAGTFCEKYVYPAD